jgi:dipeptide/tripeptide permease
MFIDPRGPRFAAALTTVVLAAVVITGNAWLLAAQAVVFALGALGRSPYGVVFRGLVRPRLAPPATLEHSAPPRFAQAVGLLFAAAGLAGFAAGSTLVAIAATSAALGAAFLNAAFGICLGCEVYLLLRRATSHDTVRTVPTDRTPHSHTEVAA